MTEKKMPVIAERVIDIICFIVSFVILYLLPQKTDVLFYLLFGIAVVLFCIGFFRVIATFREPAGPEAAWLAGLIFVVLGAALNACGFYTVYAGRGSGRSIMIATLMLIEAIVLYAMAGGLAEAPGIKKAIRIIYRIAAVLMLAHGIWFVIRDHFSERAVILGTMILIEAICLWKIEYEPVQFMEEDSE